MLIPIHLLLFWYPNAAVVFLRSLKNVLLVLEEDLAVGLMVRLIFTPLFHDGTITGRILSFFFRLGRVIIGIFGFLCAIVVMLVLALLWFSAPFSLIAVIFNMVPHFPYEDAFIIVNITLIIFGLAIFIFKEFHRGLRNLWQITTARDIWKTTKLRKSEVNWDNLLKSYEVKIFLASLELKPDMFAGQDIEVDEETSGRAFELARLSEAQHITEAYFWVAMLESVPGVENQLLKINLKIEDFVGALKYLETARA